MNVIRGLLFDNLGLKLVALLLAVLVYLNVYTDRPATMLISFPLQIADLADSLSLAGPAPTAVQAELRGTGKQLIRLRITEPPIRISLAGVNPGRFERQLGPTDLPMPVGGRLEIQRLVGPTTIELTVDRKIERTLPVAPRIEGIPAPGVLWAGKVSAVPTEVVVTGPASAIAQLDSIRLEPASITGRRDTLRVSVNPRGLPEWTRTEPATIELEVPLEAEQTRRVVVDVESPRGGEAYRVSPRRVAVILSGPRAQMTGRNAPTLRVHWTAPEPLSTWVGHRVALRRVGELPEGFRARVEPDSVTLARAN
jgi:hypothetical protein